MIKKDLQIPPSLYLAVTLALFTHICLLFKLLILCWHLETHICTGTVTDAAAAEHVIVCGQQRRLRDIFNQYQVAGTRGDTYINAGVYTLNKFLPPLYVNRP